MSNQNFFRLYPKLAGTPSVDIPISAGAQDHFRITHNWTQGDGGRDLDTYSGFGPNTGVVYNSVNYDGVYGGVGFDNWVGYAGDTYVGPGDFNSGNYYIAWAGDDTSDDGFEDVLINIDNLFTDVTTISNYKVELYGRWFNEIGTGEIDVALQVWQGGTWSDGGTVWQNSGGTKLDEVQFSIDCLRGTGTGNKLDFANYPPPDTTTYKKFGELNFVDDGSGTLTYNLDSA